MYGGRASVGEAVCETATGESVNHEIKIPNCPRCMGAGLSGIIIVYKLCHGTGHAAPCLVEFCRSYCPVLPDNAEVFRASGAVKCEECGQTLAHHRTFAYPSGIAHAHLGCDGRFYHL